MQLQNTLLSSQKHLFSIPDHISYLNCAYMGPLSKSVEAIGLEAVKRKSQPWTISPADFFTEVDHLKTVFAQLINCEQAQRIAVIPSASYGLASTARNVPMKEGQHILMIGEQFPSNVYTWQELAKEKKGFCKFVNAPEGLHHRGKRWNEAILQAIDKDTAVVAMAMVHWADGTLYDLKAIRAATRDVGALLVIDGSQSVGALPFDVQEIEPDALVVVGYKWLMGPYGTALAYFGPAFDDGKPIEDNWLNRLHSEDFQSLVNYESRYKPFANRYNVGETSQFIHVPMLTESISQILKWGVGNIQMYGHELNHAPLSTLREMGCYVEEVAYTGAHLVGIHLPERLDAARLKMAMAERGVHISLRGKAIRISTNVYNEAQDFERLLDAFKAAF
jgi:selenocysteine lyase/cysteine desulfurase